MWTACRQRWILWRLGRGLRRSDPHLAAKLVMFARLTAGEAFDRGERAGALSAHPSPCRLRRAWVTTRRQFNLRNAAGTLLASSGPDLTAPMALTMAGRAAAQAGQFGLSGVFHHGSLTHDASIMHGKRTYVRQAA